MSATLPLSAAAQQAITPAPPDPAIAAALQQVSAALSTPTSPSWSLSVTAARSPAWTPTCRAGTGVLAASDWVFAEFTRISAACGNCLEVKRDDFIEPPQVAVPADPSAHRQAHAHRQHLRRAARVRSGAGRPPRAGHRPLRLAQHRRDEYARPRARRQRRRQRSRRLAGVRPRADRRAASSSPPASSSSPSPARSRG